MKIERKIQVIGLSILLVSMGLTVLATRTITDSYDDIYTKIVCSNGNIYVASAANLQTAIYSFNGTSGGLIQLPGGLLEISQPIRITRNVTIRGYGTTATTIKATDAYVGGATYNLWGIISGSRVDTFIRNVTIQDLTINANYKTSGIYVYRGNDTFIRNVNIYNSTAGIVVYQSKKTFIENVNIIRCNASHGLSISYNSHVAFLNNIYFEHCNASGYYALHISYNSTNVTGNNLRAEEVSSGCKIEQNSENISLNNFRIHDTVYSALRVASAYGGIPKNINLNNIIIDTVAGVYHGIEVNGYNINLNNIIISNTGTHGIKIYNAKYVTVNNAQLKSIGGSPFVIGNGGYDTNNISMNDIHCSNFVSNCYVNIANYTTLSNIIITDSPTYGLRVEAAHHIIFSNIFIFNSVSSQLYIVTCHNLSMTNSQIVGGASFGVELRGSKYFSISNCVITDNTNDGISTTTTACNNYTISNNVFKDNAKAIDTLSTDNYRIIHDNVCYPYLTQLIDLNAATNSTINLCHDNIAKIVVS